MKGVLSLLVVVAACQPKQPMAPSYFHAQPQSAPTYASCQETVSCYTRCNPFTEQCMQTCDSTTTPNDATQARALTSCVSASGCRDDACAKQQCSQQIAMCSNVRAVASAQPYPQQPAPYPQQPQQPQPAYPQQPAQQPQQPQQPHYVQGTPPQPQAPAQPVTNAQPQNPYGSAGTSTGLGAIAQAAIGGSAPPTTTTAMGGLDLVFQTPAGWKEDRSRTDSIILSFDQQVQAGTDFYGVKQYRLVVLPSQPISGSVSDTFIADWNAVLGAANIQLPVKVAPLKKRLKSGYQLALDGDMVGAAVMVLYLVCGEQRCVPVLGMFTRADSGLEPMLASFFENATLKGAAAGKGSVYAKTDLVGTWSNQSATLGNYVNSSGQYVGDASIATGETFALKGDGSYTSSFVASKSSGAFSSKEAGTWKIVDDVLELDSKKGNVAARYRIFARGTTPDGKPGILLPRGEDNIELGMPRRMLSAQWYTKLD